MPFELWQYAKRTCFSWHTCHYFWGIRAHFYSLVSILLKNLFFLIWIFARAKYWSLIGWFHLKISKFYSSFREMTSYYWWLIRKVDLNHEREFSNFVKIVNSAIIRSNIFRGIEIPVLSRYLSLPVYMDLTIVFAM